MTRRPVAIVTNALYEGLSLASALALARAGFDLALLHRAETKRAVEDVSRLERRIVSAMDDLGARSLVDRRPVADAAGARAVVETVTTQLGPPTVLVVGEGSAAYPPEDLLAIEDSAWERAIDIEIRSTLNLMRATLPSMRRARNGRIIVFTADELYWNNDLPLHGGHPFGANSWSFIFGKRARAELCQTIARSEYAHGITINEVVPGRVRTLPLGELLDVWASDPPIHPNQRDTTADELAGVVTFLASPQARAVTGSVIRVLGLPLVFSYDVTMEVTRDQ